MGSRDRSAELAAVDKNAPTRVSSFAAECTRAWYTCLAWMHDGFLPVADERPRRSASKNTELHRDTISRRERAERCVSASPRHLRPCVRRPVSGLASLDMSPSQTFAQWPIDTPTLAYRCGDSTGMMLHEHAPVSRLTAAAKLHCGTLHDLSRDPRSAEARSITSLRTRRLRDYETKRRCRHKPP